MKGIYSNGTVLCSNSVNANHNFIALSFEFLENRPYLIGNLGHVLICLDMLLVGEGSGTYREILEEELNDPELIYKAFPEYERDSEQLVRLPETRLGAPGVLYVNQREFAATVPEDEMTKVFLQFK